MFKQLIDWSQEHYSHLPWRINRTRYSTLVSEIMLQQTTVSTVLNHYQRFIDKYPSAERLAQIDEEQMLIEWKGLGYYRRARSLLAATKEISEKFNNIIPLDFNELTSIKGIGPYTANAIIAIGENKRAICVDANLERVLSRLYALSEEKGVKLQKQIYKLFNDGEICTEIDEVGARDFNEALMDLGRSICTARKANCEICPMALNCLARQSGVPLNFPVDTKKKNETKSGLELSLLRVICEKDGKILSYKKNKNEWLSGQYEIPTFILKSQDENLTQYPKITFEDAFLLKSFSSAITKYKIKNYVLVASIEECKKLGMDLSRLEWLDDYKHLSTSSIKSLRL